MATKTIETTVEELRTSIESLRSDLLDQAKAASDKVSHDGSKLVDRARHVSREALRDGAAHAHDVATTGRRIWDGAVNSDTLSTIADVAQTSTRQTVVGVRAMVRRRPLSSLLVAVGTGIALGRVLDWD